MPIRGSPNGFGHLGPQADRDRPESVVAINRNAWSQSIGIAGRDRPERAPQPRSPERTGICRLATPGGVARASEAELLRALINLIGVLKPDWNFRHCQPLESQWSYPGAQAPDRQLIGELNKCRGERVLP